MRHPFNTGSLKRSSCKKIVKHIPTCTTCSVVRISYWVCNLEHVWSTGSAKAASTIIKLPLLEKSCNHYSLHLWDIFFVWILIISFKALAHSLSQLVFALKGGLNPAASRQWGRSAWNYLWVITQNPGIFNASVSGWWKSLFSAFRWQNQQDQRLSWPRTTLDGWFFREMWAVDGSVGGWEMETPAP